MIEAVEKLIGSSYMLGLIHAEEENPERKINAADEEIPPVAFEEAMNFLKAKVPMTKAEWLALEPKLRFRAFTVAKLGSADVVNKAREILVKSFEKGGENYSGSWEQLKKVVNTNALGIKPGYWENVFRTNTQSAYIAGKLQQYENTNVVAYQLLVIEDSRTSRICRHLLTASGYGMILLKNHTFWKKYGFPPYHFQCRTSIRAVWPAEIGTYGNNIDNPSMKSLTKFKPLSGFGGNPQDNGNWWMMTPEQMERAIKYGCLNRFNREENVFADYDKVWKGYTRHEGKNGGWYDLYENIPNDWAEDDHPNKPVVEFLVKHGYRIKVLPEFYDIKRKYGIKWSNPDILINGFLADIKTPEKLDSAGIKSRLRSALDQGVTHVILQISDDMPELEINRGFNRFKGEKHSLSLKVLWIYKGNISFTVV